MISALAHNRLWALQQTVNTTLKNTCCTSLVKFVDKVRSFGLHNPLCTSRYFGGTSMQETMFEGQYYIETSDRARKVHILTKSQLFSF